MYRDNISQTDKCNEFLFKSVIQKQHQVTQIWKVSNDDLISSSTDRVKLGNFVYHATHLALAFGLEDLQVNMKHLYKVDQCR